MANSYDVNLTVGSSLGFKQVGGLIEGDVPILETIKGFNDATSSTAVGWAGNAEILYVEPLQIFGILVNNTSSIQEVALTNYGDADIELFDIYFVDHPNVQHITNYSSSTAVIITPGNTYTFELSYIGSIVGEYTSQFIIDSDNTAGPYRVLTEQFVEDKFDFRISPVNIYKTVSVYGGIQSQGISIVPAGGLVDEVNVVTTSTGFRVRNVSTSSFIFEFDPDDVNNINGVYTGTVAVNAESKQELVGNIFAVSNPPGEPIALTVLNHGIETGTRIIVGEVTGMVELNSNYYYVDAVDPNTLELYTNYDSGILSGEVDGSTYNSYASGGIVYSRAGGTLEATMTVTIDLGTFLGYDSSGRSVYENWRTYGNWMGTGTYYDSIVGVGFNRINGRRYLTIGVGATGTNEMVDYVSGGHYFIESYDLGIAGVEAVPPFSYWNTVYHIPLNVDGDYVPKTYFSNDYKVKNGPVDYGYYFGDYRSFGSPFIVEDNGKNTVLVKINHLRELSGDERVDTTLDNLTRALYYYQGRTQPGEEFTGNLDPYPINSSEDAAINGAYTRMFIGFYINPARLYTATIMTSIVPVP